MKESGYQRTAVGAVDGGIVVDDGARSFVVVVAEVPVELRQLRVAGCLPGPGA